MEKLTTDVEIMPTETGGTSASKLAIICGGGNYPKELADKVAEYSDMPLLIGISNEAGNWIKEHDHEFIEWGQIGHLFNMLSSRGITRIAMAGSINARPEFSKLKLDWGAIRTMPDILKIILTGDDTLLSGVAAIFKKYGVEVVGAEQLAPQLIAGSGILFGPKLKRGVDSEMKIGIEAAKAIGAMDVGQGVVVLGKRVVAVEAAEGTDAMLQRVAELRVRGRLPDKMGGTLIKCAKPRQDKRFDLPSIGEITLNFAAAAKLTTIAIEAASSLILDQKIVAKLAKSHRISVYGFEGPPDE